MIDRLLRRVRPGDDRGALLIIAIIIITVVALVTGFVLTRGDVAQCNGRPQAAVALQQQRAVQAAPVGRRMQRVLESLRAVAVAQGSGDERRGRRARALRLLEQHVPLQYTVADLEDDLRAHREFGILPSR